LSQLEAESGVNSQLLTLNTQLSEALEIDEKLQTGFDLVNSAQLQSQEAIYELTQYLSKLSSDDQSAEEIEERISELYGLGRKHNCQIEALLTVRDQIEQKLNDIGGGAGSIEQMNQQLNSIAGRYQIKAQALSKSRAKKAQALSQLVTDTMQELGMPGSEFKVGLDQKIDGVHLNGNESVDFLVKTNMGQDFNPLKKVASGGELSRFGGWK